MTHITIAIDTEIYRQMKKRPEIEWNEFIKIIITNKINKLEREEEHESFLCMLASEEVLKRDWDNEWDEHWNNV